MSGESILIGSAVAALALGGLVAKDTIDVSRLNALKAQTAAANAQAQTRAAQSELAQEKVRSAAALAEADAQQRIVVRTRTVVQKVPSYVTPSQDARTCISYGLVRVLDASALGVSPDQLPLPTGKSDDDCAPVEASTVAKSIAENYGTAQQNAEQLNALIAEITGQVKAANQ